MLTWWTIGRATGVGGTAAMLALLLWPLHRFYGPVVQWPFALSASVAGSSGLSILAITGWDMIRHRRGGRIRAIRTFDIAFGSALILLSFVQLQDLQGQWIG